MSDDAKDILEQIKLMGCKVVEIATSSDIWLETPRTIFRLIVIELSWRTRESYLHIDGFSDFSRLCFYC